MTRWFLGRLRRLRSSGREGGYAAIVVAVMVPTVFLGMAAFAVDTANWYSVKQRLQKAADAAALAGVPYLPYDLAGATTKAKTVAAQNGYNDADADTTIEVGFGSRTTQLRVTITTTVDNNFGKALGAPRITLARTAVADYQGPQPMGSPCNTFGNEPASGTGGSSATPSGTVRGSSPYTNCPQMPQYWGVVEGPRTDKVQGDQYQNMICTSSAVDGCTNTTNNEYDPFGYVFVVKVQPDAVNTNVTLQLFDPEWANTGTTCGNLPNNTDWPNDGGNLNPYVTKADARTRYADPTSTAAAKAFCTGDNDPNGGTNGPVTSFVLRSAVSSQNPKAAPVQADTSGSPCIRQYGAISPSTNSSSNSYWGKLLASGSNYNSQLAQTFHNWTSFCTFKPTEAGDYYLQVRTNVSLGGTCVGGFICSGNASAAAPDGNLTTGAGSNGFSIRAVTNSGLEKSVAVAGYNHMPIYINATGSTSTFNLIRVPPGAAGQFISFSFFDAADAVGGDGTIQVLRPTDATGSITSTTYPKDCTAKGGYAGSAGMAIANCSATVKSSTNNGKLETITVPVPTDYDCTYTNFGGCWFRVQVTFTGATSVTDVTTWNATVVGDPVRLIE